MAKQSRFASVLLGLKVGFALAISGGLAACSDETGKPYVEVAGGGFIFNYRAAEAYYGISLKPLRRLAAGTVIEAAFENPAGGPPLLVRETVFKPQLGYALSTPTLTGIVANTPYKVVVRVREPVTGKELQTLEKTFRSDVDQGVLPAKPLTIGPTYRPNPDALKN